MDIYIKVAPQQYERLRSATPLESPAHEAINKATRIEHSLEGVLFEGYDIPCDENQARTFLKIANQCCPDLVPRIEQAIRIAQSG
jgi:hypothetical protein